MSIEYASSAKIPGCVMMPSDDTSENFTPERRFVVLVSGAITGAITIYGIPSVVLEDDDIADKTSYWTELEPGFEITNTDKTAAFDCMPGLVVQARAASADAARYLFWGYAY